MGLVSPANVVLMSLIKDNPKRFMGYEESIPFKVQILRKRLMERNGKNPYHF